MDKIFIEVRDENQMQTFLNLNHVSTFKQAKGNGAWTELLLTNGQTIIIHVQFHEFRKSLGLDK